MCRKVRHELRWTYSPALVRNPWARRHYPKTGNETVAYSSDNSISIWSLACWRSSIQQWRLANSISARQYDSNLVGFYTAHACFGELTDFSVFPVGQTNTLYSPYSTCVVSSEKLIEILSCAGNMKAFWEGIPGPRNSMQPFQVLTSASY